MKLNRRLIPETWVCNQERQQSKGTTFCTVQQSLGTTVKGYNSLYSTTVSGNRLYFIDSRLYFYFCHCHCVTCCGLSACLINEDIYIYSDVYFMSTTCGRPKREGVKPCGQGEGVKMPIFLWTS